jgi:hypothetical protein
LGPVKTEDMIYEFHPKNMKKPEIVARLKEAARVQKQRDAAEK